jgi:hypothetical protein
VHRNNGFQAIPEFRGPRRRDLRRLGPLVPSVDSVCAALPRQQRKSDVHEGRANVRVVSNRGGGMGGGGSLDRLALFVLLPLVVIGARKPASRRA